MIQTLPPAQRNTMLLAYEGFQATEISEILGVSDATVRSNLRHARKTLREKLLLEENQ
jgi:RNA polymerase sigma factor (sigma-70 family)